ncbi:MAG: hypothetical protein KDD42_04450, partial [Bdellovibrionales bacterium]|nr:hypothetical protein [Bdellovibrionales bacterium]
ICLFALDPDKFIFNNLGYHLNRSGLSLDDSLRNKLQVLGVIVGALPTKKFVGWQNPILLFLTSLYLTLSYRRKSRIDSSIWFILTLVVLNLVPRPTYVQYFVTLAPFLSVASALGFLEFRNWLGKTKPRNHLFIAAVLTTFWLYLWHLPQNIYNYTVSGFGVPGTGKHSTVHNWHLSTLERVGREIDRVNTRKGKVIAMWPGYLLASSSQPLPGTENQFGRRLALRGFSDSALLKYKILSKQLIQSALKHQQAEIFVINEVKLSSSMQNLLRRSGYRVSIRIGTIRIYKLGRITREAPT